MELRPYQNQLAQDIRSAFGSGAKRPLAVSPTGSGKTVLFSYITNQVLQRGSRVIIVAHRKEILEQISATLKRVDVPHGFIQSGKFMAQQSAMVASIQTLARRFDKVPEPDLVIIDECFVRGTLIGDTPIENIRPGMRVVGWDGCRFTKETVVRLFRNRASRLVTIRFSCGRVVTCTLNHPFAAPDGRWIRASELTKGMVVVTIPHNEYLCDMRRGVSKRKSSKTLWESEVQIRTQSHDDPKQLQKTWRRDHSIQEIQRNEPAGSSRKGVGETQGNEMEASGSWWKRIRAHISSAVDRVRARLENGSSNLDSDATRLRLSNGLQDRRRKHGVENRDRGGRIFSQRAQTKGSRHQESSISGVTWVESVEIHELGGQGRFDEVCPDGLVYNFETTGTHTYTANGIVVHNCHHAVSKSYIEMFATWPNAKFIGVTATPERLDGKGLGAVFDRMVMGPTVGWLIDNGFLARPVYYAPREAVDLSGVSKLAGDYNLGEAAEVVDTPKITGDAVTHYRRFCPNQRAVAFCISVAHSQHVAAQFEAAGIPAASIDGQLDQETRKKRVEDLTAGRILVLTSCELISEGFDLPTVNAAILLRPTMSLSMHLQQLGRALRPYPGKSHAVILDHVGNCLRHGLAEQDREWDLDGREKRKSKSKPVETKQCSKCFAIFAGTACPQCGTARVIAPRDIDEVDGELQRLSIEDIARKRDERREEGMCRTLDDFRALAARRGYKPGWAFFRWKARSRKTSLLTSIL